MTVYHTIYRPADLTEIDIADVSEKLGKIISSSKMPQAFLFCGPKGSGKTSAARVLAKMVNGIKDEIAGNIDIMEMDAASNRGIDDIRSLKDHVYLSPASLKYKVFIIDEAHMLTKEAFNALLKVLEEPPSHVIFVLCTTEANQIPETVISRLVKIDFRKASEDEVLRSLSRVVKGEKLKIPVDVLKLIFAQSEGSFRNATRLLQEMVMACGQMVDMEMAKSFFAHKTGDYDYASLEEDLELGDSKKILEKLQNMASAGVDMESYTQTAVGFFQEKLLSGSKLGGRLVVWLKLLIEACKNLKDSPIAVLPLQIAVVEFLGKPIANNPIVSLKHEKHEEVKSVGAAVAPDVVVVESGEIKTVIVCEVDEVVASWLKILSEVSLHNRSLGAFLRASKPIRVVGSTLFLEVFYAFHKHQLEDLRNKRVVEECLSLVLGKNLQVEYEQGVSKVNSATGVSFVPAVAMSSGIAMDVPVKAEDVLYDVAKEIFG